MLMKILTTKWFRKWSRKADLSSMNLLKAVYDLEKGCLLRIWEATCLRFELSEKAAVKDPATGQSLSSEKMIELFSSTDSERVKEET